MELLRRRFNAVLPALAGLLIVTFAGGPPGGVLPPESRGGGLPLAAGVHAPNRPWTETDFQRVADARVGAVKLLSYHSAADATRLLRDQPGIQLTVRLMSPWNELPAPEQFVAQQAPGLRALVAAGVTPWVEIGNEPNLELHPAAVDAFITWYGDVLDRLRAAVPEARYGFPGLARDRREAAWWDASAAVIARSDWLGVHAYWHSEREMMDPDRALQFVSLHRRFPDLPILITEAGNDRPGVAPAEKAAEYDRFARTAARLPYVRGVYYFILSGTPEWQGFFLDDATLTAIGAVGQDPVPVLDGALDTARTIAAVAAPLVRLHSASVEASARPAASATPTIPTPTPPAFMRRTLLSDRLPAAGGQWLPLPGREGGDMRSDPGGPDLRTASTFLGTDFSARLTLPAPAAGHPMDVQLAEGDLWADGNSTGFGLRWDGGSWRLQYHRTGTVVIDAPLVDTPLVDTPPAPGASDVRVELALERRSAAAWVWPQGTEQPKTPGAVFAPPTAAELDGARPRALFIPAGATNVVLEGATRD